MAELTTKEIGERLNRSALNSSTLQDLVSAIAARRRAVNERLAVIEDGGAARRAAVESGNSGELVTLNRECEALDDEGGILSAFEVRAFRLHLAAVERETVEAGKRGHARLGQAIAAAEKALAAYTSARQQLDEITSAIDGANQQLFCERTAAFGHTNVDQRERLIVDEATLDRILAVLLPPTLATEEQRRGSRAFLRSRICAPIPEYYGEPLPDVSEQVHNIFQRRDS